ncbi:TPA: RNA polymerase sigma factor [bacterium]|nr:RNA polymerase sigma factor [bacterium]
METRLSDEELIRRIKNGDQDCLEALVKLHLPKVHNRVNNLVPEYDVDDVTQDIFVGLINSIYSFEERSAFATWFHRLTMNKVADYHRKTSRNKYNTSDIYAQQTFNPWEKLDNDLVIEQILREIPNKYKEILILRHSECLSFIEIAQKLDLGYEATRSRYRRAIFIVRKKIRDKSKNGNTIY